MKRHVLAAGWVAMCSLVGGLVATGGSPASAVTSTTVQFGTWNLSGVNNDPRASGDFKVWRERRPVVANLILQNGIDVVGVQEANPSKVWSSHLDHGTTQYADLVGELNRRGGQYRVTVSAPFDCENATTQYKCVYQDRNASGSNRIIYNQDKLALVSTGARKYVNQAKGTPRFMAWAVLRHRASGETFLFTTTHLAPGYPEVRVRQWNEMIAQINRIQGDRPVIVTGDFNYSKFDEAAQTFLPKMKNNGYGDALDQQYAKTLTDPRADSTVRQWVNSYNMYRRDIRSYAYEDNRSKIGNGIDWIFVQNRLNVREFEVVVNIGSDLHWQGTIPSDHNLLRAAVDL